jgi:anaerobic carbon-monoxide dehydrogenase iron sulfur subunit
MKEGIIQEIMMGFIKREPANCSGCLSCEMACSLYHFGYFDTKKSRIQIIHDEELSHIEIHQCVQCDEKSCVTACPVDALSVDPELGCIRLNEELCIGCRACQRACAYNGVMWDDDTAQPLICDLCDGDPECLKPCRLHRALVPGDADTISLIAKEVGR